MSPDEALDELAQELTDVRQERDIIRDNNDALSDDNKRLRRELAEAMQMLGKAEPILPPGSIHAEVCKFIGAYDDAAMDSGNGTQQA